MDIGYEMKQVPISQIDMGQNDRTQIDKEDLGDLMESIKEYGLLEPVGLVNGGDGDKPYRLIYGNRRMEAFRKLKLKEIPAVIHTPDADPHIEGRYRMIHLTENLLRKDLHPIDAGRAFSEIIEQDRITQTELAARLSIPRGQVKMCMNAFLRIPEDIKKHIARIGTPGKKLQKDKVTTLVALRIQGELKSGHINSKERDRLIDIAKRVSQGELLKNMHSYIQAVKRGKSSIDKHRSMLKLLVVIDDNEMKRLSDRWIKTGKYKTLHKVAYAILAGKIKERVDLE